MWPRTARWALTGAYALVILALTTGKSFFRIGYLWDPANQHVRELRLVPFEAWARSETWFGPLFDAVGNVAFFVPLGWLLATLLRSSQAIGAAAVFSVAIEVTQYAFALGRTDVTDVMLNVLGAVIGVGIARLLPHRLLLWVSLLAVVAFAVLLVAGPYLGDPDKVVPVG